MNSRANCRKSVSGLCWLLGVSLWFWGFNAAAIVDANSRVNTNAPTDGAPWGNVGAIGNASGVYVGGGWVLTASHVGASTIKLMGTSFSPDGVSLRLTNSDGSPTDLVMFHLASVPPLPSLPLVTSTPAAFTKVDLIGWGYIAGSGPTNIGIYTGFYWSGAPAKSWGDNKINLGGTTTIDIGYGTLTVLTMDFTSPGTVGPLAATANEAEVASGDSGGGVFVNGATGWQLAGILDAEGAQLNQPGGTSVYGDKSYAADIATYRSEIVAVLSGGPVPTLTISGSDTNTLIHWQDTGLAYTLQASSSLAAPSWTTVSQAQASTNGQVTVVVPALNGFRSFRLRYP